MKGIDFSLKAYGRKTWLIPDTFLSSVSGKGEQPSHEAICIINTSSSDAHIKMTLLFEQKDFLEVFNAVCPSMRTNHIRMDKIKSNDGNIIPRDTPYALIIESNTPIVVQYSRLDTSSTNMALMTTIAYPVDDSIESK